MKRKNLKKLLLCLALVLSLTTETSLTAFAGTGNISLGGMSTSWGLYSSYMSTTLTYTSSAFLQVNGYIREQRNSDGYNYMMYCTGLASSSKKLSFNSYPDSGWTFKSSITGYHNEMNIIINGNLITSYSPNV